MTLLDPKRTVYIGKCLIGASSDSHTGHIGPPLPGMSMLFEYGPPKARTGATLTHRGVGVLELQNYLTKKPPFESSFVISRGAENAVDLHRKAHFLPTASLSSVPDAKKCPREKVHSKAIRQHPLLSYEDANGGPLCSALVPYNKNRAKGPFFTASLPSTEKNIGASRGETISLNLSRVDKIFLS